MYSYRLRQEMSPRHLQLQAATRQVASSSTATAHDNMVASSSTATGCDKEVALAATATGCNKKGRLVIYGYRLRQERSPSTMQLQAATRKVAQSCTATAHDKKVASSATATGCDKKVAASATATGCDKTGRLVIYGYRLRQDRSPSTIQLQAATRR